MSTLPVLARTYTSERRRAGDLAPESARSIRHTLLSFCSHVGDLPPAELAGHHVERWLIETNMAASSARTSLSRLRVWSKWLIRRGHLTADPTADLRAPRQPRLLPRGLAFEDVQAVMAEAADSRGRLILLLMVQEGLRCCEVAWLEVGDINIGERLMAIRGKGGHERVLPISEETWAALGAYRGEIGHRAGPLVRSISVPHRGITPRRISTMVGAWLRDAGINATAHALRHTAATDMLRAGAHLRDVQAALGHTNLSTTQRYLPWIVGDLRTAMGGRRYDRPARRISVAG